MAVLLPILCLIFALLIAYILNPRFFLPSPSLPPPILKKFGDGFDDDTIKPFKIPYDEEQIENLRRKLNDTIFFDSLPSSNFRYGVNDQFLRRLCDFWLEKYDWRQWTEILNANFQHFKTKIAGLDVHFARRSPKNSENGKIPVLLLHGWPGSIFEFYKLAPILTGDVKLKNANFQEKLVFDIVSPSIPGYGWSEKPTKMGFSPVEAAKIFVRIMDRLNFRKFYCQGGDWGSLICINIALMFPEKVLGIHLNMAPVHFSHPTIWLKILAAYFVPSLIFDDPEKDYAKIFPLSEKFGNILQESGYFHYHATKPDTVGFALLQSPMALAAYLCEKFSSWTDLAFRDLEQGGVIDRQKFTYDELLTNIMIYYTTDTILTSQRLYKEHFCDESTNLYENTPVKVPTGLAAFPNEVVPMAPRTLLSHKFLNMTMYQDMPRGGHFAALEEPELLAKSFFDFVCKNELLC